MIGMLTRNESDWAANAFGQTLDRHRVVTLSSEFMVQDLSILAGRTFGFQDNYFGLFGAFKSNVWTCLLMATLVMPVILVLSRLLERNEGNVNRTLFSRMLVLYGRNLMSVVRTILFESIEDRDLPKGNSGRILIGLWLTSIYLTMSIFQGTMKASLLISSGSSRIDSMRDLVVRKQVVPIIWRGTAYHKLFQRADMDIYQTVYSRAMEKNGILPGNQLYTNENFMNVLQGRAVIINEQSSIMYNLGRSCDALRGHPGEFYFAKEPVYTHGLSMSLRKTLHPMLKRVINKTIRELQETGNIRKWLNIAMADFFTCEIVNGAPTQEEPTVYTLGLSKLKGPLIIYGMGAVATLITLCAELAWESKCFCFIWQNGKLIA
ncbi:glutamate receptor-like isoform X2 [Varroa jacobsoni]|uniref:glutamate receptor-like isoform X2 n=1 Tax=Varroa jacobsoni TaxID=62625 RepID=UPI000BF86B90|nr:glutamate receptor-like isoform X2 [Varroa jacobsoni]